jgi:hypothetical protein
MYFHDLQYLLWYCHMCSEIIQILEYDNYEGFYHLNFI